MKSHYLALALSLFSVNAALAKEFPSLKDYEANKSTDEVNRRHWLKADRESNDKEWREACLFNFSYATGYKEYRTREEREDFYRWAADTLRKQGHEIKWVELALEVTDLIEPAVNGNGKVSQYAKAGNALVFDSAFVRLQNLFRSADPLKNEGAKNWDDEMIKYEQEVLLASLFNSMDIVTLEKISRMAKGQGIYMFFTKKELRFKGDIRSAQARIDYAHNQLLPYLNEKINAAQLRHFRDNNISAEDSKSIKAANRYLNTLEEEKKAPAAEEKKPE